MPLQIHTDFQFHIKLIAAPQSQPEKGLTAINLLRPLFYWLYRGLTLNGCELK
jgi:hypothetical protein